MIMKANLDLTKIIEDCANKFDRDPECFLPDRVLKEVFSNYPVNDSLEAVLHKVAVLDALYNIEIFDVYKMARHITRSKNLDTSISRGNLKPLLSFARVMASK